MSDLFPDGVMNPEEAVEEVKKEAEPKTEEEIVEEIKEPIEKKEEDLDKPFIDEETDVEIKPKKRKGS